MNRFALFAMLLALLAFAAPLADAQPATGSRWALDLEHGRLRIVSLRQVDGTVVTYHYMTLRVTNNTGLPRDWTPLVRILTDTDRTFVAAGFNHALEAIQAQESNDALVPIETTSGKIQTGQTLDTVAIFGPVDPLYDRVRVQVFGLTDPIAIYKVDTYPNGSVIQDVAYLERNKAILDALAEEYGADNLPEPEVQYQEIAERRVYQMHYERLGDEFRPDDDVIDHKSEGWTIVDEPKVLRVIKM
ncbi:MAG: hypothetical protein ACYTG6_03440 [Planctomycetota bacterium]|jgi:hypothetical protein